MNLVDNYSDWLRHQLIVFGVSFVKTNYFLVKTPYKIKILKFWLFSKSDLVKIPFCLFIKVNTVFILHFSDY